MNRGILYCGGAVLAAYALMAAPALGQKLDNQDEVFVKEAAMGNLLEIKLGEYAQSNATNEDVKKFGLRMAEDHGKANKDLTIFAKSKGLVLPTKVDAKCEELCDKISKLKGNSFDKEYIRHMVEDHVKDVAKYETAAKTVKDADLRGYINNTLPVITEHLRLAKEIHAKVEGGK